MAPRLLLLGCAACLGLASSALAEIYKWVDREGKTHYTSDLNQVPASQRDLARASGGTGKGSVQRISTPSASAPAPKTPLSRPAAPTSPASPAEDAVGGRTEAEWRADARGLREQIAGLEERAAECKKDGFRWSPDAGSRAYEEEAAEANACQRVQSDLDLQRRQLEQLEERAQRAGVPPGWIRE
jgi:hypothetical protein